MGARRENHRGNNDEEGKTALREENEKGIGEEEDTPRRPYYE